MGYYDIVLIFIDDDLVFHVLHGHQTIEEHDNVPRIVRPIAKSDPGCDVFPDLNNPFHIQLFNTDPFVIDPWFRSISIQRWKTSVVSS